VWLRLNFAKVVPSKTWFFENYPNQRHALTGQIDQLFQTMLWLDFLNFSPCCCWSFLNISLNSSRCVVEGSTVSCQTLPNAKPNVFYTLADVFYTLATGCLHLGRCLVQTFKSVFKPLPTSRRVARASTQVIKTSLIPGLARPH